MEIDKGNVLIIGGGIAGIQSALDLAEMGFKIDLIEKESQIGGRMAQLDKTFPTNDCSICILSPKLSECHRHPNITIHTLTKLVGLERINGEFRAKFSKKARYVNPKECINCGLCVEKCPVKIEDKFDQELRMRKAIYLYYLQGIPAVMTIDKEKCLFHNKGICKICEKLCPKHAIMFDDEDSEFELFPNAIIVATGFDQFDPTPLTLYGYGKYRNVITGLEFERLLSTSGPTMGHVERLSDNKSAKEIAFVQCVGSRDVKNNPYCSSVCCMYATKQAILAYEHDSEVKTHIYYIDMRAGGKGFQKYLNRARNEYEVHYVKGIISEIQIDENENPILFYEDLSTFEVKSQKVDMVVLESAMIPCEGAVDLCNVAGIERDGYDFIKTKFHSPLETNIPGIYVCGCSHGPRDIPTSVAEASGAAAKAAEFILKI